MGLFDFLKKKTNVQKNQEQNQPVADKKQPSFQKEIESARQEEPIQSVIPEAKPAPPKQETTAQINIDIDAFDITNSAFETLLQTQEEIIITPEEQARLDAESLEQQKLQMIHQAQEDARLKMQQEAEEKRLKEKARLEESMERERLKMQKEAERIAKEKAEAERVAQEQAEAERVAQEQAEVERVAQEQAEEERVAQEQAEAERVAQEQAEEERVAQEQAEAERVAQEQAEAERVAQEQAEAERVAQEQAEAERVAQEQAEAERIAQEQAEAERIAQEQAEAERVAQEQAEAERVAQEQAEAERVVQEQAEAERIAQEQAEAEQVAQEQAEAERVAQEQAEVERVAQEQAEAERIAKDQARLAKIKAEQDRQAKEEAEAKRIAQEEAEAERVAQEQAEAERVAQEQAEAERIAQEQAEAERIAQEQAEAERIAKEQAEAESHTEKEKKKGLFGKWKLGGKEDEEIVGGDSVEEEIDTTEITNESDSHIEVEVEANTEKEKKKGLFGKWKLGGKEDEIDTEGIKSEEIESDVVAMELEEEVLSADVVQAEAEQEAEEQEQQKKKGLFGKLKGMSKEETEEHEKEVKKGFFAKLKDGLTKTRDNILGNVDSVLGRFSKIDEELFEELEETLIMADIGVDTTMGIVNNLRKRVKKEHIIDPNDIKGLLAEEISALLSEDEAEYLPEPSVLLVIGVNGVGKTTTIGKLANRYKNSGKSVLLGAADTFRAAAIDQLEIWGERAEIEIVKREENADPASVVFDAVHKARKENVDLLICDTAGRLHNKKNLMEELRKISKVIDREYPTAHKETYLVLDATTGQNALQQAKMFQEVSDITGIILTKLDGTAKGGIVVTIKNELNIPVRYIGVGEGIDDLQEFHAGDFAKALFSE